MQSHGLWLTFFLEELFFLGPGRATVVGDVTAITDRTNAPLIASDLLEEFDRSDPNFTLPATSGDDEMIWSERNDSHNISNDSMSEMRDGEPATE